MIQLQKNIVRLIDNYYFDFGLQSQNNGHWYMVLCFQLFKDRKNPDVPDAIENQFCLLSTR